MYKLQCYDSGTEWIEVPSPADNLVHISAGLTRVVVVSDDFKAWMRNGISADTPAGYYWVRLEGTFREIRIYETTTALVLYGLESNNLYYQKNSYP